MPRRYKESTIAFKSSLNKFERFSFITANKNIKQSLDSFITDFVCYGNGACLSLRYTTNLVLQTVTTVLRKEPEDFNTSAGRIFRNTGFILYTTTFMTIKDQPFYSKATITLFGLILFMYVLYILQGTLIPIAFALVLAILLNPVCNWLLQHKVPKIAAVSLSLLLLVLIFVVLTYFLSSQLSHFIESLPALKQKLGVMGTQLGQWLQANMGVTTQKQTAMLNEVMDKSKSLVGPTIGSVFGTLGSLTLLPVYIYLFLYYKTLFLNFLFEVFAEKNAAQVGEILNEVKAATQSYMVGLLLEALIVAALNSVALLLLDVKYAVLFGVIGALLNMIPYIGGIVAIALPVLMATATKDGYSTQLWIVASYLIIQFIDNNILVPNVVSSKVQINAFISVITVLLGGALWGVSGMFLSIPFTAILKIIFDRVPSLKPWGKLLGDTVPLHHKGERWGLRKRRPKAALSEKLTGEK